LDNAQNASDRVLLETAAEIMLYQRELAEVAASGDQADSAAGLAHEDVHASQMPLEGQDQVQGRVDIDLTSPEQPAYDRGVNEQSRLSDASVDANVAAPPGPAGEQDVLKAKPARPPRATTFVLVNGGLFRTVSGDYGGPQRPDVAIYPSADLATKARAGSDCVATSAIYELDSRRPNVTA
jgi:hypothetical protein